MHLFADFQKYSLIIYRKHASEVFMNMAQTNNVNQKEDNINVT